MSAPTDTFVTPEWLHARLGQDRIVPVEASFFLPDEGKDAEAIFRSGHIPGAVRFDVDAIADHASDLPHMLPTPDLFAAKVGQLGIAETDTIVVYDRTDLLGGARAWWMFEHYGAQDVRLLEGGMRAWLASDYPVEGGPGSRSPRTFLATAARKPTRSVEEVAQASADGSRQIVDARAAARFAGTAPEPRAGLRAGHMPGARNLPWRRIIDEKGCLRGPDDIAAAFAEAGVDLGKPIIASCGSGVSAAVLILGLEHLGIRDAALYDGSWSEWGGRPDLPLETGSPSS